MTRSGQASIFYLDESGNSGDLTRSGRDMDFGGQEIFALASIGTDDPDALARELERLRQHHRVQAAELKSSALKSKPALVGELLAFLRRHELPLLVEVVDKRFMIVANMINNLVLPAVGACDVTPEAQWFRNELAEYLQAQAPPGVIAAYVAACDAPSATSIVAAFDSLLDRLDERDASDERAEALRFFTRDSLSDFMTAGPETEAAQQRCLPPPDLGKKGQSIWMLPNLTSLTNIYARINRYRRRRLTDVVILHDEQAHFDAILADAKALAERLAAEGSAMPARFADYHLVEHATLNFASSAQTPGIQAADVVAGFVMRYVKSVLHDGTAPDPVVRDIFDTLMDFTDPVQGLGVNFVLTNHDVVRLGVQPL
jgi:uncharacterized protein YejL (UPF0352 family)